MSQINGQSIKQARQELNMTQETLQDLLKRRGYLIKISGISRIEAGKQQPGQPLILADKLSGIFHKQRPYFLMDSKPI